MEQRWNSSDITKLFKIKKSTLLELQSGQYGFFKPDYYNGQGKANYYSVKNLFQFQVYEACREMGISRSKAALFNNWVDIIFNKFPQENNYITSVFNLETDIEKNRWLECYVAILNDQRACSFLVHSKLDPVSNLYGQKNIISEPFAGPLAIVESGNVLSTRDVNEIFLGSNITLKLNFTNISLQLREKIRKL